MSLNEKMTALADAVRSKANRSDTLTIDAMTAAVNGLVVGTPSTQTLTVIPTKEKQTFSSSDLGSNTYYSVVTVNAIPSEYITTADATASTYDILEGETAYVKGSKVTGRIKNYGDVTETFSNASDLLSIKANGYFNTITVNLTRKTLEITPTKSTQTLHASSEGSDVFYTQVNVAPIPEEYITTADATATAGAILEGETAYVNGEKVTGVYIPVEEQDVRWGVNFGYGSLLGYKAGSFTGDATAEAEDIAPGKTAYVLGRKVTGAMPSKQAETYTPGTADITITSGVYLSEAQTIKGDSNLTASNIKAGVSIFGVGGTFTSDATAEAEHILAGKTAYVDGKKITGTIEELMFSAPGPTNIIHISHGYNPSDKEITVGTAVDGGFLTPGTTSHTIPESSYLTSPLVIEGDSDLTASNIKSGISIFNVSGTFTSDATATASDIANGKTAYVDGQKVTGTGGGTYFYKCAGVTVAPEGVSKTWQGYKAILVDGSYEFETTATTGLSYGAGYTPVIGKIYNSDATIRVASMWSGLLEDGLLFYAPLTENAPTAETGQSITYTNCTFTTHIGIPCMRCNDGESVAESEVEDIPQSSTDRTIGFWGCPDDYTNDWMAFFVYGEDSPSRMVCVRTEYNCAGIGFSFNDHNSETAVANDWHHFALTYGASKAKLYVDGVEVLSINTNLDTAYSPLKIGSGVSSSTGYRGYIADFRIYNRVLGVDEIQKLAAE